MLVHQEPPRTATAAGVLTCSGFILAVALVLAMSTESGWGFAAFFAGAFFGHLILMPGLVFMGAWPRSAYVVVRRLLAFVGLMVVAYALATLGIGWFAVLITMTLSGLWGFLERHRVRPRSR